MRLNELQTSTYTHIYPTKNNDVEKIWINYRRINVVFADLRNFIIKFYNIFDLEPSYFATKSFSNFDCNIKKRFENNYTKETQNDNTQGFAGLNVTN